MTSNNPSKGRRNLNFQSSSWACLCAWVPIPCFFLLSIGNSRFQLVAESKTSWTTRGWGSSICKTGSRVVSVDDCSLLLSSEVLQRLLEAVMWFTEALALESKFKLALEWCFASHIFFSPGCFSKWVIPKTTHVSRITSLVSWLGRLIWGKLHFQTISIGWWTSCDFFKISPCCRLDSH
jgi:hypothetical protein